MFTRVERSAVVLLLSLAIAACGGGSDTPSSDAPAIQQYAANQTGYVVGERARLTVRYTGGTGRIEPGIGPVASGTTVDTPVLDVTSHFKLIVEGSKGSVSRELTLNVAYRNRYRTLAQAFPVSLHSAVLAGDGSVIVIGGSRGQSTVSNSIDRFDPASEKFTKIGSFVGGPFTAEATARLSDGRILVVGGRLQSGIGYAEVIDERTGETVPTDFMDVPRLHATATALADDRVLVTGGSTPEGYPGTISPTASIWDPATNEFRRLTQTMHVARVAHTATLLEDGRVLIVGGFNFTTPYVLAEIFDPRTETFTIVPSNVQSVRALHESIRLQDGDVLVVGGENDATVPDQSVLLWDRESGVFETMPNLLAARSVVRADATRLDQLMLFGGVTTDEPLASVLSEGYTRSAGGAALPELPQPRAWHTVTRLTDGRVLILGGENESGGIVADVLLYE